MGIVDFIKDSSNKDKGIALVFLVAFVPLTFKLFSPFFIIAGLGSYTGIIMPTLLIIGLFLSLGYFVSNIRFIHVVFYVTLSLFVLLSSFFYPISKDFVDKNATIFIFQVVPYLFIGLSLDYSRNKDIIGLVARIGLFIQLLWQFCILAGLVEYERADDGSLGEQMGVAYGFLFPLFVMIIQMAEQRSILDIVLLIIGIIMLFLMGTRGPIIVFLLFVVGYFILFKHYKRGNAFKKALIVVSFGVILMLGDAFMLRIIPYASDLGFSTRVFDSFLGNQMLDISNSSYRDDFYYGIWGKIINDPTGFGYGWGSDRLFTPSRNYTHNFELEILCQFGYIGGGVLLLALIALFIYCVKKLKGKESLSFWFVMLCCGLGSLQFSYSYINYPLFFVFLGYCFSIIRFRKEQIK